MKEVRGNVKIRCQRGCSKRDVMMAAADAQCSFAAAQCPRNLKKHATRSRCLLQLAIRTITARVEAEHLDSDDVLPDFAFLKIASDLPERVIVRNHVTAKTSEHTEEMLVTLCVEKLKYK